MRLNLILATVVFTAALATTSDAQTSAREIADEWVQLVTDTGQTITVGSEHDAGGTLTLNDVQVTAETDDGHFTFTLDWTKFRETSDGAVEWTFADEMGLKLDALGDSDDVTKIVAALGNDGLQATVSGSPVEREYRYNLDRLYLVPGSLRVDGEQISLDFEIEFTDFVGGYVLIERDDGSKQSAGTSVADRVKIIFDLVLPDQDGQASFFYTVDDIEITSASDVVELSEFEDISALGQVEILTEYTSGAADFDLRFQDGSDAFSANGAQSGSTLAFEISDGSMRYSGSSSGLTYSVKGSEIPLPSVDVDIGNLAFNFLMPFVKSDDSKPFNLLVAIRDLNVAEGMWAMVDPAKVLPRDPATVVVDISGDARILEDLDALSDPEAIENMEETPIEVNNVTLNELTVSVGGAELIGTGNIELNYDNTEAYGGLPVPVGILDFALFGGHTLLDNLLAMGLLTNEMAMAPRMMLGIFTRPGDGPDHLISRIEMTEDGGIVANGQQFK